MAPLMQQNAQRMQEAREHRGVTAAEEYAALVDEAIAKAMPEVESPPKFVLSFVLRSTLLCRKQSSL